MKNKRLITCIGIIVLVIISSVICIMSFGKGKLTKDVKLDGIKISEIEIKSNDGVSTYKGEIKATKDIDLNYVDIKLLDKDKKEIVTLIGYVGKKLNKGETYKIEANTDADIKNAERIDYTIHKLDE